MSMEVPGIQQLAQAPNGSESPRVIHLSSEDEPVQGNALEDFPDFGWQPHPDQDHAQLVEGDTHVYVGTDGEGQTVYAFLDADSPVQIQDKNTLNA